MRKVWQLTEKEMISISLSNETEISVQGEINLDNE